MAAGRCCRDIAEDWVCSRDQRRAKRLVQSRHIRQISGHAVPVGEQSDRAGLRLRGEAVQPRIKTQLLTDGIPLGAIQVPQDGQPIILFVDQQTTGGYPKIANVIAADMHRIGQLRPREEVRFAEVSIAEAVEALRCKRTVAKNDSGQD